MSVAPFHDHTAAFTYADAGAFADNPTGSAVISALEAKQAGNANFVMYELVDRDSEVLNTYVAILDMKENVEFSPQSPRNISAANLLLEKSDELKVRH